MATKARPAHLAANAASIVDQAANTVIERVEAFQAEKRPFSNHLVRIANSPELVRAPLSDVQRAAVQTMLEETRLVQQRAQLQTRRQQRLLQRFDDDLRRIRDQEQLEAQAKARMVAEQREHDRRRRAELALRNIARRAQMKLAEQQQLRKARTLVRRSATKPRGLAVPIDPGPAKNAATAVVVVDPRWKQFVRRYRKTKWLRALSRGADPQDEICARLLRRHDYGVAVRQRHVPVASAKLHAELAARIDQLRHPAHVRQPCDVRALHPVVGGRPGTDKPDELPQVMPAPPKRYANYLGGASRTRIGLGHLSREELEQKVQTLDQDIAEAEGGGGDDDGRGSRRPRDAAPGRIAEQRAHFASLYVKAITAKAHLCDICESELQLLQLDAVS